MNFAFGFLVIGIIIPAVLAVGSGVLLGFSVYYDAMYRRNENAVMWAVLSGFFQLAALIYLILHFVEKHKPMRCIQCGEFLVPDSRFCMRCGRQLFVPAPEQLQMYDKRRRLFFWLWIASIALVIVVIIIPIILLAVRYFISYVNIS
ncbi:MAG: zinc ribbon domain-containing protein [Oscillospiraceae bacterium]|nr:zinc ribbon domain-containing protein [Oscillospiraceae bacterium]